MGIKENVPVRLPTAAEPQRVFRPLAPPQSETQQPREIAAGFDEPQPE